MPNPSLFQPEPSLAGALMRHWRLALAVLVVCGGGGVAYAKLQPKTYGATASVAIPSPPSQSLGGAANPAQYEADQLTLLQSPKVAEGASRSLRRQFPRDRVAASAILANLTVTPPAAAASVASGLGSADALVNVTLSGPRLAAAAANDVVEAYKAARTRGIIAEATSAIASLDASINQDRAELASVDKQLNGVDQQIAAAQAALQAANQARINEGLHVSPLGPPPPNASQVQLQGQQTSLQDQINGLVRARDQRQVDEQAALAVPVDILPALPSGKPNSPSPLKYGAIGAIAGIILAAGLSYVLALARPRFGDRRSPEAVFDAPLLGDVPCFEAERITTPVPVGVRAASGTAEAFRYVAASLRSLGSEEGPLAVLVSSAGVGDGKTTVAANLALALAEGGARVLAIDADFVRPRLASLLADGEVPVRGLADVIDGRCSLDSVTVDVAASPAGLLRVLGGALDDVRLTGVANDRIEALLDQAKSRFDFVLVDGPPLLAAAFATDLLSCAGRAVVVVNHQSPVRPNQELATQIRRSRAQVVGYVYNRAPLRKELTSYYYYSAMPGGRRSPSGERATAPGPVGQHPGPPAIGSLDTPVGVPRPDGASPG